MLCEAFAFLWFKKIIAKAAARMSMKFWWLHASYDESIKLWSSREQAAVLVDVSKVDANVGLHARRRHLKHPGGGIQPLCQPGHPLNGLQAEEEPLKKDRSSTSLR